jgi:chloramphenicol 3-O-phosphotransferase
MVFESRGPAETRSPYLADGEDGFGHHPQRAVELREDDPRRCAPASLRGGRRFAAAGECWFVYAMDDYFAKVPFEWVQAGTHVGPHADQGVVLEIVDGAFRMRMGPIGRQVLVAWRGAVASAVRAGLNVIADDVILTEQEWRGWQDELEGLDTHWVRVQIALDVLEAREQARGNRMVGQARAQYEDSYRFPVYDAEVDTGTLEPDAAADAVLAGWRDRTI